MRSGDASECLIMGNIARGVIPKTLAMLATLAKWAANLAGTRRNYPCHPFRKPIRGGERGANETKSPSRREQPEPARFGAAEQAHHLEVVVPDDDHEEFGIV